MRAGLTAVSFVLSKLTVHTEKEVWNDAQAPSDRSRVLVVGAISAGIAIAAGAGGKDEAPLTGSALERATDAALAHAGGGTVTETEVGDDGAAYSVEVRLADGSQVEVNLDENFKVIGDEQDDDGPGDDGGPGDDD